MPRGESPNLLKSFFLIRPYCIAPSQKIFFFISDDSECTDCLCIQFGVKMDEAKFKENFEVSYSREEIATKDSKYFNAFQLHTSKYKT